MSETGSMWLKMLGLDGLWETANSPDFQAQIAALVAAILETRIRVERLEYKLDQLLDRGGTDERRPSPATLLAYRAAAGAGTAAAASVSADAGACGDSGANGADRDAVPTADWRPGGLA